MGLPYTVSHRQMQREAGKARRQQGEGPPPHDDGERPVVRGDCEQVQRPCPYVSCRYNLFLDVAATGSIKFNHGQNPEALLDLPASCALDVAARGPHSLDEIGVMLNVTRERVRQVEESAIARLQEVLPPEAMHPGAYSMPREDYVAAPLDEAADDLNLGEDASWLTKIFNAWEAHGGPEKP